MTMKETQLSAPILQQNGNGADLERYRPPITLCLAGVAVVMNVLAALLSLMALSVS